MSASPVRIEANRANAQLSTGPITPDGKQRSSENAITHGLTAKSTLLPNEDPHPYKKFSRTLIEDLNPKGALEEQLVQTMADTQWRLKRCRSLEKAVLASELDTRGQIESLNKLSMYEQRLTRNFLNTLKQFRELQAERQQREERDLKEASKIMNHCQTKQIDYNPAEDGFVFTSGQLETWMRRHQRYEEADLAGQLEFNKRFLDSSRPSSSHAHS
jgi:hypothetical protein